MVADSQRSFEASDQIGPFTNFDLQGTGVEILSQ
jgi:hypothetical protein